jgi:hypothetical protein
MVQIEQLKSYNANEDMTQTHTIHSVLQQRYNAQQTNKTAASFIFS